ncbi:unnamed protein product [Parascedosporium putredinis]|uniref:Uncharacterized protein n=1 Tax=Parascedosporium putredinis TaxID=1442378 RepID=A0A9P1M8R5_9PEZI|nr:unnamed protein product [Parascedosporium putredinis]CAI7993222.1 unnamed protein product [Parascedosporium putredinis]
MVIRAFDEDSETDRRIDSAFTSYTCCKLFRNAGPTAGEKGCGKASATNLSCSLGFGDPRDGHRLLALGYVFRCGDDSGMVAIEDHTGDSQDTVKAPDATGDKNPYLIAPVIGVYVPYVVVVTDNEQ